MFQRLVPVSREQHGSTKVRPIAGFSFARSFHLASLAMQEFVRASAFYPIVFLDDRERDMFRPVALLGLESGENLCIEPEGAWLRGAYIPGIIRRYPFALANTEQTGEFAVCVDEAAGLLDANDGMPLFDPSGAPTETLENIKRFLGELQQMDTLTAQFSTFLARHNLLRPLNLRVRVAGAARDIAGSYVINEERLEALNDSVFLEMRGLRYLQPVYAHLSSLPQIDRLIQLKESALQNASGTAVAADASAVKVATTPAAGEPAAATAESAPAAPASVASAPAEAPKPRARRSRSSPKS